MVICLKIQGKDFSEGELVIYTNYERSEHAGAGGCFQIVDIYIEADKDESILTDLDIDQGRHYHNIDEVLQDLQVSRGLINFREEKV